MGVEYRRDTVSLVVDMYEGETEKDRIRGAYEYKGGHFALYLPVDQCLPLGRIRITIERTAPGEPDPAEEIARLREEVAHLRSQLRAAAGEIDGQRARLEAATRQTNEDATERQELQGEVAHLRQGIDLFRPAYLTAVCVRPGAKRPDIEDWLSADRQREIAREVEADRRRVDALPDYPDPRDR